jgi:pimeloyl-ACP methyl ester carboxylesterase
VVEAEARRDRLAAVEAAFRSLPGRYLGASPGFDAHIRIKLPDVGNAWDLRATETALQVRRGAQRASTDATIVVDSEAFLAVQAGSVSGIEVFERSLLEPRGDIDLALGFEGLFQLPDGRPPLTRLRNVQLPGGVRVNTLTIGSGERDVLLLHGLGSSKLSMLTIAAALGHEYRCHVVDLPGFGSSSKPPHGPYGASWLAQQTGALLDALGLDRVHVIGNSLGGRVAIELALRRPGQVEALGLLCPAVAFVRRGLQALVRIARPEFGLLPHGFRRGRVTSQFRAMFANPDSVDPRMAEIAIEQFLRTYRSAPARYAFLAAARSIYLDNPYGRDGFYPRLASLAAPALFVWGERDPLIPPAFKEHVSHWLPGAEQIVLSDCGHVPQVELPRQTLALLRRFFRRVETLRGPRAATA